MELIHHHYDTSPFSEKVRVMFALKGLAWRSGLLAGFPWVRAWRERSDALGHGRRTELSAAEALEVARTSTRALPPAHDPADPLGLEPGTLVTVAADDYGRDPIPGRLVALRPDRIVNGRARPPARPFPAHRLRGRAGLISEETL